VARSKRYFPVRTATVRRNGSSYEPVVSDICVVGAGISGISAAIEAARLGRRVTLVDSLPVLGGQAVNGLIGTFAGLLSNGRDPFVLTYGVGLEILRALGASGDLRLSTRHNTVLYDYTALSRWIDHTVYELGIVVILGGIVRNVVVSERRIDAIDVCTKYGEVRVSAQGFVDASGDAALTFQAGLPCHVSADAPIYGSQKVVLENVREEGFPVPEALRNALREAGPGYGVSRTDGIANLFAGRGLATLNMTHNETPLHPVSAALKAYEGRVEAEKAVEFLRGEFPEAFRDARVRALGLLGVRQTRWIAGREQLSVDDVLTGRVPDDAIARTGWGVELHSSRERGIWDPMPEGHLHYVSFGNLIPQGIDNVVAAGRCIDGDTAALSSVRVMGPCMATGAAAAHALDIAGGGRVDAVPITELQERVADNLSRVTPYSEIV
jgi:hypothetical protein